MGNPLDPPTTSPSPPTSPTTNAPDSKPRPTNPPTDLSHNPEIIAFATRMYDAARQGRLDIFQQALPAGLPPNMTNDKGDTLLMLSSYHGHAPLVSLLLHHGADPNIINDRGQSPLAGAIFKGEKEIVRLLVEEGGADLDLGRPSAREAVGIFGVEEEYAGLFGRRRGSEA